MVTNYQAECGGPQLEMLTKALPWVDNIVKATTKVVSTAGNVAKGTLKRMNAIKEVTKTTKAATTTGQKIANVAGKVGEGLLKAYDMADLFNTGVSIGTYLANLKDLIESENKVAIKDAIPGWEVWNKTQASAKVQAWLLKNGYTAPYYIDPKNAMGRGSGMVLLGNTTAKELVTNIFEYAGA
ncbi:hypothetical protein PLESTB_001576800 [Pleodorina starrii]|uniref:Uncharacterized protein n=1 Tax=Pleodorina starrii TaxID=330485 RepID=A0A9W6BYD2_9CHLO|nr:hypothetical protein PLESTM_000881600 [Pleodorina starrii]GLC39312.1 hypothetical protein PLESTM_000881800 [Pleodorina starrii]GLC60125.1 hypothetical protein PLESTB_001576600 [Pleodorina starrii]GLC60127.1 hypothetical protein PLESTB_001576800 [Pleodorina starrii]GLC68973.1 hypothetical protein PLESTF_000765200 [Pleodorina starrii]